MRFKWYIRAFGFFAFVLVFVMILKFKWTRDKAKNEFNDQRLIKCIQKLEKLRLDNAELDAQLDSLDENEPIAPSKEYELLRRRIFTNTKEFWNYVNSGLESLGRSMKGEERIPKIKSMVGEHYRSLLKDISSLAEVDDYSTWRQEVSESLSNLVQNRLEEIQNPVNWFTSRQLVCRFDKRCGFNCQLHHIVYCLIVAYSTQRVLVLDLNRWPYGGVWLNYFLPLSDDSYTMLQNITIVEWPGDKSSQIIHLPPIDSVKPRPPCLPPMIPDDLAPMLTVLHGDPIVWWIGQILKYILRPQKATKKLLKEYAKTLEFYKPIVGVHVRRTDKIKHEASVHQLDEYMFHVEEYYKRKELSGKVNRKRIYLSTDEPTLFDEAKRNYPEYEIVGSKDISKSASVSTRHSEQALIGIIVDIHFLSLSDHLVCTFSSQLCRVAYEKMNSLHPDASNRFTSLDDIYYFGGQHHRLNEAVLPHKASGPHEIDLQVADQIFVYGNHWNGYSKGKNLRTELVGLYPTFKIISKIETEIIEYNDNEDFNSTITT